MQVLAIDLWADYGHFRKFYTTSSPLTFSFPPVSTIAGMLGAIYGASKSEYLRLFSLNKCKISLRLIKPVNKVRMGINQINTKGDYWVPYGKKNHEPRTPIRIEFLKDPHFRIYFSHQDIEIFQYLCTIVKEHKSVFTVSMGLSELLADFRYIGIYEIKEISNNGVAEIVTPIPGYNLKDNGLEIETGKKYFKDMMPIIMSVDRIIKKYDDVIYEPDGKMIKARLNNYARLENGENVSFF